VTIQITKPEVEALINRRLKTGAFKDAEDVILQALRSSEAEKAAPRKRGGRRSSGYGPSAKRSASRSVASPFVSCAMRRVREWRLSSMPPYVAVVDEFAGVLRSRLASRKSRGPDDARHE
jgi:hypothetical protein